MTDSTGAGNFDPRYDRAFQPGYAAAEGNSGRVDGGAGARGGVSTDAVGNRVPRPGESDVVLAGMGFIPVDINVEPTETDVAPADVRDPNPFERTLWVVALVLVIGGVAASLWANSFNYVSSMNAWGWPQMIQTAAWAVTTPMVTVGLGTGVGLLFRRAIAWTPDP